MATTKRCTMKLTKSTKNKHVYSDIDDNQTIPSVYIEKSALSTPPPDEIRLTIQY